MNQSKGDEIFDFILRCYALPKANLYYACLHRKHSISEDIKENSQHSSIENVYHKLRALYNTLKEF